MGFRMVGDKILTLSIDTPEELKEMLSDKTLDSQGTKNLLNVLKDLEEVMEQNKTFSLDEGQFTDQPVGNLTSTNRRPDWDDYFMRIAHDVSLRSTCMRRAVGAVAVSTDHRILGTGYNGALPGAEHCDTAGCIRNELKIPSGERQEICRAQHAEANVCNIAAKYGTSLKGATMYITTRPCTTCLKAMVTCGIDRVVFDDDYPDDFAMQIAKEAGIEIRRFKKKENTD